MEIQFVITVSYYVKHYFNQNKIFCTIGFSTVKTIKIHTKIFTSNTFVNFAFYLFHNDEDGDIENNP